MVVRYIVYVYALLCVFHLSFAPNSDITSTEQVCACTIGKCIFEDCTDEENCNRENVALGKSTEISSVHLDPNFLKKFTDKDRDNLGCLAVNGITTPVYELAFDKTTEPNCIQTATNDMNPSWTVFFGKKYVIQNITIYTRKSFEKHLSNVTVTVDNVKCYTFPTQNVNFPDVNEIQCQTPLEGSNLKLQRNTDGNQSSMDHVLTFCELQVWVCKDGFFGSKCDLKCNPDTCKGTCNIETGECSGGCKDGFYGYGCGHKCGYCEGSCNDQGICENGCLSGYQGDKCTTGCEAMTYGKNCNQICGRCILKWCLAKTGECAVGCVVNFAEPLCQACVPGYWGEDCKEQCGHCEMYCPPGKVCPKNCYRNGSCMSGCKKGYEGLQCMKKIYRSRYYDTVTDEADTKALIVVIITGAVSAVTALILLALILKRSLMRDRDTPLEEQPKEKPRIPVPEVSVPVSSLKLPLDATSTPPVSARILQSETILASTPEDNQYSKYVISPFMFQEISIENDQKIITDHFNSTPLQSRPFPGGKPTSLTDVTVQLTSKEKGKALPVKVPPRLEEIKPIISEDSSEDSDDDDSSSSIDDDDDDDDDDGDDD